MESNTGPDPVSTNSDPSSQQALLCSLLNGSDHTSSLASSLAQLPEAKNLLSQILTGTSTTPNNLQQVLSAVSMVTQQQQQQQQQQRLPTLKPTNSSSPAPQPQSMTTPTQPTPTTGRKRGRPPSSNDQDESLRKRRGGYSAGRGGGGAGEKQSKGLRHFSQLVCEKVREKGITSYNEVADELVRELDEQEQKSGSEMQIDQKNIRRRVYDALNVLMAMNIISKEKKEIRWIGLPTNSVQECEHIQTELAQYEERITRKKSELHELVLQILTLKNLMKRNRERSNSGEPPTPNSAIGLPFILVNTNRNTVIDCSISSDKSEYVFNFDNTFELHQDVDILKKMGLDCGLHTGNSTPESLAEAKSLLPKMLEPVLDEMAEMSALSSTVISPQSPTQDPPSTPLPSSLTAPADPDHTPSLLNDVNNGPSYSSSPMGAVTNPTNSPSVNNSPNHALAAALSSLQNFHQISGGVASPTPSTPSILPSPLPSISTHSLTSPAANGEGSNSITLPGSSVTARPLPLSAVSPKTSIVPVSPLLKAQLPAVSNIPGSVMTPGRSPGTKVVTVQPLPGNASVADIIASLQQNVSNLLKQQHHQSATVAGGGNSTAAAGSSLLSSAAGTPPAALTSLLNGLQQQSPQSTPPQQMPLQPVKSIMNDLPSTQTDNPGKFLNPSTT